MEWLMWAHRYDDPNLGIYYMDFWPDREIVELYGLSEPIVRVKVIEYPEGSYWGWIDTGDTEIKLIQPHQGIFSMQFPYTPEAEVEHGRGCIVRLIVEELSE
jgi:hypothetical protein